MKKLFLYLLPACFIISDCLAQEAHDINLLRHDPEGINNTSPLPQLNKMNDAETQYILLDNTSGTYSPKEWQERPHKIDLFQNDKALDNTPYLPKRKYDPWLKKWNKG